MSFLLGVVQWYSWSGRFEVFFQLTESAYQSEHRKSEVGIMLRMPKTCISYCAVSVGRACDAILDGIPRLPRHGFTIDGIGKSM